MKEVDFRKSIISQLKDDFDDKKDERQFRQNQDLFFNEENKRRIYLEERDRFYQDKPDYIKIINDIGEDEWIKEEDLKKREGYFNFEEDMDDAATHRRKLFTKYLYALLVFLVVLAVFIIYFVENTGYIDVESNRKNGYIFLDGEPTGLVTDNTLEEISAGKHVVKVNLAGYISSPDSIIVDVKAEEGTLVSFELIPAGKEADDVKMEIE